MNKEKTNQIFYKKGKIGGLLVQYYFICERKIWLYDHQINFETTSDRVALGSFIDSSSFSKKKGKNIVLENNIQVDFWEDKKIHETKLSSVSKKASFWQLYYYMWYFKEKGIKINGGVLHYPKEKRKEEIILTDENTKKLQKILNEIKRIKNLSNPPKPNWKTVCNKCAYLEFCWS